MKVYFKKYVERDLRGFLDIELNNGLLIKGFKLFQNDKGYWIGFPSQKGKYSNFYEIVRPISNEVRKEFTQDVIKNLECNGVINGKIGGAVPQSTRDEY